MFSSTASAELVWQQTRQSRSVDVRQAATTFYFRFRNAGTEAISILEVKSLCSCFHTKLDKREYASGESGVLQVQANLNGREGRINKSVNIVASDRPDKPRKLNIDIRIPKGYELSTRRLVWQSGDASTQTCVFENQSKTPVRLVEVSAQSEIFDVELEEIREGFEYKLHVQPSGSGKPTRAIIQIKTESLDNILPRTYKVYAFCR